MSSKKVASKKKTPAKKNSVRNSVKSKKTAKKAVRKTAAKKSAAKKTTHKRNTSGLKPFKPGESGNPAGRPKGSLNFNTRVDIAINVMAQQFADGYNKRYAKSIANGRRKEMTAEDVDIEGDIFRQFLNKARSGDQKAIDSFMDRRYGKAKVPIELSGDPSNPIKHEVEIKKQAELAQNFFSRWFPGKEKAGKK